ncbi:hypothetical protein [Desulfovibrio sp. TomC]|uniref:hypothetical protein n=1 Tax=Desulfovibrio sp. TomC TaxID=1562888 RepID=UPI0005742155|nr:hypothetical protein [Desulfovibrio sp. TomC]KHK02109.1 hypothetical protein NY78_2593 [Desulfovibrio sp. TomC]
MQPTPAQFDILRAAAAFSAVERYSGTMPKRQALHYDKTQLTGLEHAGFLERVKLSFPCGKDVEGWRLTGFGRLILADRAADDALEPEHLRILSDVYHYSRLSQNRGMMPKELARTFDADDVRDLFMHGYLLRIHLKGAVKAKGWVVSNKGLAALRRATGPVFVGAGPQKN